MCKGSIAQVGEAANCAEDSAIHGYFRCVWPGAKILNCCFGVSFKLPWMTLKAIMHSVSKQASFGAHYKNLSEDGHILAATKM